MSASGNNQCWTLFKKVIDVSNGQEWLVLGALLYCTVCGTERLVLHASQTTFGFVFENSLESFAISSNFFFKWEMEDNNEQFLILNIFFHFS